MVKLPYGRSNYPALAAGRDQLRRYVQREELRHETGLRAWLAVYVGAELAQVEEVGAE